MRPAFEDISTRFILRLYDGVSDSDAAEVERIIESGVMAPSFDHVRKWHFIVISDPAAKAKAIECIEALPYAFKEVKTPIQEMIKIAFPKQKTMFEEAPYLVLPLLKRDRESWERTCRAVRWILPRYGASSRTSFSQQWTRGLPARCASRTKTSRRG